LDTTDPPLPETRFARAGEVSIAYQTMGKGPLDLIVMPGMVSHVEFFHEVPNYTRFLRRLASFARVVTFDKRGQGLSDRVPGVASLEERADDLEAVMTVVRSERAALLGFSEGASLSALYSATHPQRVSHLVLYGGFARFANTSDFSLMYEPEILRASAKHWGKGYSIKLFAPSLADDPATKQMWGKGERLCVSPGAYRTMVETNMEVDVRAILPQIRVPTLVLHRATDLAVPVTNGRFLANAIPGAKYIEYPSGDHVPYAGTDFEPICGDIEEFITGHRGTPADAERVLATVLFTDIVESTQLLTRMGDRAWRQLLDEHDRLGRRVIEQHRGRFVKSTGDGLLATFDGPARAIRCAQAFAVEVRELGATIRAGLHTGEIERRTNDVGGLAVHVAARVLDKAAPGEVVVSRVLPDLVAGSGLEFEARGRHELKGLEGAWELFAVRQA
jgi:class 3 adenylate cyclase/pimeloyl-ACP methyl ester carboxylesterase